MLNSSAGNGSITMEKQIEKYFRSYFELSKDDEVIIKPTPEGYDVSIIYAEPMEYTEVTFSYETEDYEK